MDSSFAMDLNVWQRRRAASPGYLRPLNISYDPDCYYVRLVHRKPRCQYDIYPMTRHLDGVATDGESVERVWALQSRSKM